MTRHFERLLNPRGIAIVGASAEASRPGGQTVLALKEHGYTGGVYPVNPKYPDIAGYRCYPALAAIDDECDLAVVALPAAQVPGVVRDCAARGIRYAVVLGGGFRETGEAGAKIEADMLAAAREGGVRLIGPNCLGLVNVHSGAYAAWGSLTRPPRLAPGPVSVVVQSASFGMSIVIQCAQAGVGFRYVITSGNEADISAPEIIDAYVDDPETKIILSYLEGVSDGRGFMAAARRALAAGKPIVVIKAGNTEQGRRAAESHTANLTGDYDIYRAAFRQCGVIEVTDVQEAVDVTTCVLGGRLPKGRRVGVIGGSGGAAAMFSDQADLSSLEMPPFTDATLSVLTATLPPMSVFKNPLDYTAGYPRAQQGLDFQRAFQAAVDDPNMDALAVMFAAAGRKQVEYGGKVLAKVAAATDKPLMVFSGMNAELAPEGLKTLREAGVPVLASPKRLAATMARLADYAEARRKCQTSDNKKEFVDSPTVTAPLAKGALSESDSKRLIASAGIAVTRDALLPLAPTLADCAGLPYPVALKIVSPDIAHKTDVGGVQLDIGTPEALVRAASEIVAAVRRARPDARLTGLLASEMIRDGIETIIGVVNDPGFGPVVAFGLGGVLTEVLRDVTYRVAPFDEREARTMIGELRGRELFDGVRGRPRADIDALAVTLARVSELAWQLRDRLKELDVNPLLVRPAGLGVAAADALVVLL